jgi:sulfatase-modifying factor enzyme 1
MGTKDAKTTAGSEARQKLTQLFGPFISGGSVSNASSMESTRTVVAGNKAGDRVVIRVTGVDLAFRWCPAGTFQMGSAPNETGRSDDENQVSVTLTNGFWMPETEVTQELWTAIMGARSGWTVGRGAKYPAYDVSHDEAFEFCRQLNNLLQADAAG